MKADRRKLVLWVVVGAAALFALQGGQYSTLDLLRHRGESSRLRQTIDSVGREIDSLSAYRKALLTNPRVQERIARELWGMSKPGEIVYRFADTTGG